MNAQTDQVPNVLTGTGPVAGDHATSVSTVETTRITAIGLTIEIGMITSTASATCTAGPGGLAPVFSSGSSIASLKINGLTIPVGSSPATISLVLGTLALNNTVTTATGVTQRAVVLDTPLVDVVIGESKAGVAGTPVHPTGTPCTA